MGIQLSVRRVATAALNATKTVTIKAGDTLSNVLQGSGIDRSVTLDVVEAVKQVYNPRRLQSGQEWPSHELTTGHITHAKLWLKHIAK